MFGLESDDALRAAYVAGTISSLNRDDEYATLNLANAIWPADWFEPYGLYTKIIRDMYRGEIESVSYTEPSGEPMGIKRINQWAEEKTEGRIKEVVFPGQVNSLTAMVLTNAIYFKGAWLMPFAESNTREKDFVKSDEQTVKADFMRMLDTLEYAYTEKAQILKMPYEVDRLSMLLILPPPGKISELTRDITAEMLDEWRGSLEHKEVAASIPKFTINAKYDIIPSLTHLGMTDAFDEAGANLSGIGDLTRGNLYVSSATHDAFVEVNEKGTEAAAVTSINLMLESHKEFFTANHPFIFII